ncbi:unnamed protein product [Effrenium voratum]|nr:unnamed protein product [Effrenium voratum]
MALSLRHALSARTAFRWDFSRWKASARGQGGYRAMALKVLPLVLALAPVTCLPTALVYESTTYLAQLSSAVAGKVGLRHCPCELSEDDREGVVAVVGMPRNITILKQLPQLKLVQSSSYMYPCLSTVPTQAAVAKIDVNWTSYGAEPIAEFVIAAVFHWSYDLSAKSALFGCGFGLGAPGGCPADSVLTSHPTVMGKRMGVVGYGTIGEAVVKRAFAMGMEVLASRRHGPFSSWLISDTDRVLAESDFVAVTVPGSVKGLINKTSLALMKPGAVLIPISANPVDFDALYQALLTRSIGAVLDVWPQGCWHFPDMFCGPPYSKEAQPYPQNIRSLSNVLTLPGVAMRDDRFWSNSAAFAGKNLVALANGSSLQGVVRNASAARAELI